MNDAFLPMSRAEMEAQGIDQCDFIVVTPDAYADHPSFAMAIVGRFVQSLGFSVGVIAQPDWKNDDEDFLKLGAPRYAFLVSGGNMDGMVALYTSSKHLRREDDYTPGGVAGKRPVRPTIVYTTRLKSAFSGIPVIIGGVEASNRRFAHYDYLEDQVRRSYLVDSKADLLVYGMGEAPMRDICAKLRDGASVRELTGIRGTCVLLSGLEEVGQHVLLPSFESMRESKKEFADACHLIRTNTVPYGKTLVQAHGDRYLIAFPPALPFSTPELDAIYELPFVRRQHPSYTEPIPALQEVKFGVIALRGCPAQCAFCSIGAHQGKRVTARSKRSVVEEVRHIAAMPEFKGIISDVGGPTANFYGAVCTNKKSGNCSRSCLSPKICEHLRVSHKGLCELLEAVERVPDVRRVFIRSGIRYDYLMADKAPQFFDRLVKKHVSGQLKVAPEHVNPEVLWLMNKPPYSVYERFAARFSAATKRAGKPQFLLPYYISSHPGSTLENAVELALALKKQGFIPEQVQDFYPTPGTLSTCMYHTGLNPLTGKPVYVADTPEEKAMQRALLQFNQKRNWKLIRTALHRIGREDLIGPGRECLVPEETRASGRTGGKSRRSSKPDTGVSGRPDFKRGSKPGNGKKDKPDFRYGSKPGTEPGSKSGGKHSGDRDNELSGRPDFRHGSKPGHAADGKLDFRHGSKPGGQPKNKGRKRP